MTNPRPPMLAPMLAGGQGWPSSVDQHQIEPKLDGQRLVVLVADGVVELRTRNGNDATGAYPELAHVPGALGARAAVLDGEVVVVGESGATDFGLLQSRMHVRGPSARLMADVPVVFVAFDVLWLDGELLIDQVQAARREILEGLGLAGAHWQTAPVLHGEPSDLLAGCRAVGLEGVMTKRLDAPYRPGQRSTAWSKVKVRHQREFVVGGWVEGDGGRSGHIGSLAIGYCPAHPAAIPGGRGPTLRYVGQVGSGLSGRLLAELEVAFSRYAQVDSPFLDAPTQMAIHFVVPLLVVEVAFAEVTRNGTLRAPTLLGLRPDVAPDEVIWDPELDEGTRP